MLASDCCTDFLAANDFGSTLVTQATLTADGIQDCDLPVKACLTSPLIEATNANTIGSRSSALSNGGELAVVPESLLRLHGLEALALQQERVLDGELLQLVKAAGLREMSGAHVALEQHQAVAGVGRPELGNKLRRLPICTTASTQVQTQQTNTVGYTGCKQRF